jgi:hypothetical protein
MYYFKATHTRYDTARGQGICIREQHFVTYSYTNQIKIVDLEIHILCHAPEFPYYEPFSRKLQIDLNYMKSMDYLGPVTIKITDYSPVKIYCKYQMNLIKIRSVVSDTKRAQMHDFPTI